MNAEKKRKIRVRTKFYIPGFFIVAILLITYIFPRQGKFKYAFSEGRPWQYKLLTAPFDFPIYKPIQQLKAEQDSLLAYYEPYFYIDEETIKYALTDFDADLNVSKKLNRLPAEYKKYLRNKLRAIYDEGIMQSEYYDKIATSQTQSIRLKKGNVAESREINSFYTIRSAYKSIFEDIPHNFDESLIKAADINNYIRENIVYDASTSEKAKAEFIQQVSPSIGMVQAGQRIIDQGEIVNTRTYNILSSLKRVTEERSGGTAQNKGLIVGQFLLIALLLGSFHFYLLFFRPMEYRNRSHVTFMLLLVTFFIALTAVAIRFELFNVYIIPYVIVTILICTFIDSRTALFASLVTIISSSLMVPFAFEFVVIEIVVAIISIFMLKELTERSQLIRSSFFILLTYFIVYLAINMYQEGDISKINWVVFIYFLINFIFIMFSYLLVYMVEKSFGFISGVSMIELANINRPLLKELSEKAPGTFQHSMQVSNLGVAGALKIGANASLIRTGALYHDIGKMKNPAFFTENQMPGMNPHEGLPFEESARIIINHVKDGVEMATKYGLPKQIIDFIRTHHGTSMPKYFYNSWKNANPDKEIDESIFRYPGPNPFTKETAIMMMADTVEAASRSLTEYTEETISALVDKLIDSQLNEGLFRNAPITFNEVEILKKVFIDKLLTIYHSRVKYPELKKEPAQ